MKYITRERDERDLMAMHLVEVEHLSCKDAGKKLGLTKNTIIGLRNRINMSSNYDRCVKKENQTGGMPELWWQK